ncbi:MAG: CBS domain-containing protein [Chloroflexi bacterium]|nr:CBS domain-containing protein [Chloroflexota bacterium]
MHLIYTHERADFDAIASLWAASLLYPEAAPILPRELNRNVRGFLTLYGEQFPFTERSKIKSKVVHKLTLVDFQNPATLKGLGTDTQVNVIDHHPLEADLDSSWQLQVEQVGATATLLVESLQNKDEHLLGSYATLLLLGIYEDTGSLTYPGTTPRDVRASAWLLERGASLTTASDFLRQPISEEQRNLLEQLIENAVVNTIQGLEIVIARGEAGGTTDEISTLAHRLGDIYDPAAVFLIVGLSGRVQIVARSYSESIHVGRIAQSFGGGGHSRAAAALVKNTTVQALISRLTSLLQESVVPSSSVGEIMSRSPQLLDPSETVAQAAERMKRYGHEGYPVTDAGEVVGLLTRRAVDRALAHGMQGSPVSEIMEAGSLVVHPEDSIRHLQRVMIEHNWGQVPVSDPESGEVIGIVTRTDLLNSLDNSSNFQSNQALAEKLDHALTDERLALLQVIARESEAANIALYIVGGFVRDLILGAPSIDFDLVVEGDAVALGESLADKFGGQITSHRRFGTAKWQLDLHNKNLVSALQLEPSDLPETVDFVSARTEFYSRPTALPSVAGGSIKLDLHRRDFSINTLALRLDGHRYGQLLDPWGGGKDIRDKQIRVLHSLSFVDDPTRMLRAVRLEQRLGFSIESRTLELLERALPLLDGVSGERIRGEMSAILKEPGFGSIMIRLKQLGLLQAIHPALDWDDWIEERTNAARVFSPPDSWKLEHVPGLDKLFYAMWLYRLPVGEATAVCERLHMSQSDGEVATKAGRQGCDLTQIRLPSEWVSCLNPEPEAALVVTWLALGDQPAAQQVIESYLEHWRWIRPNVDGDRLRELGLAPGPAYGKILGDLRAAWLDGKIDSAQEEQRLLAALMKEAADGG